MKKADFPFFSSTSPIRSVSAYNQISNPQIKDRKVLIDVRKNIDFEKQNRALELESALARVTSMRAQEELNFAKKKLKLKEMFNNSKNSPSASSFMRLGEEDNGSSVSSPSTDLEKAVLASQKLKKVESPRQEQAQQKEEKKEAPQAAPVKTTEELKESLAQAEKQNKELAGKIGTDVSAEDLLKNVLDDLF